jgi:DNA-binding MarR family transcriptional regulator
MLPDISRGEHMDSKTLDARLKQYNDITKENDELYREAAKKFGLSVCEFWILYFLRVEYAKPMQSEICSSFYLPKQSIHSALKKLEADGYIMQTAGGNKRSKRILLTKQGEILCGKTVDHIVKAEKEALGSLSEKEQEIFMDLFEKYTGQFKKNMQTIPAQADNMNRQEVAEKGGNIT